jgi:hypothetical protein
MKLDIMHVHINNNIYELKKKTKRTYNLEWMHNRKMEICSETIYSHLLPQTTRYKQGLE